MTFHSPWRNLQSVMVVTFVVAVLAYMIRNLGRPDRLEESMVVWLPLTIALAAFVCWPIGHAIAKAMAGDGNEAARICPRCRRHDIRPLIRVGSGIFQPVSRYRCASCWTIFRVVDGEAVVDSVWSRDPEVDPTGIEFVDTGVTVEEIRFLDPPSNSPV